MEFPKYLFLDTPENSILCQDEAEEKIAREKGFRDVWGSTEEQPDESDEKEALKAKLKAAGVPFGGNTGIDKLRALVAEKGL